MLSNLTASELLAVYEFPIIRMSRELSFARTPEASVESILEVEECIGIIKIATSITT